MTPLALIGYAVGAGVFVLVAVARATRDLPRRLRALVGSFEAPLACWACDAPLDHDEVTCPACHVALPAPLLHRRYVVPGRRYDGACPRCHTPFRRDDYRRDAEWSCPACKAPIPR